MNGDYSSRSMELNCKRDINFMFLLEGHSAPDHATLARFRSIHFAPCSKRILAFRNIKIKIFKTYIGLLKYANFWNIPFILINSNLSPVNKQLKATFIWFSFLSSLVQFWFR